MGIKGKRPGSKTKYKEPDLFIGVDSILDVAKNKGFYSGNSLNIEEVIKSFDDIELRYEPLGPIISGSLKNQNNKWILSVNSSHSKTRQKFTIAHELGHYMLHKEKNIEFEDTTFFRGGEMDSIEFAANEFAARLLIPEDMVKKLIDGEGIKSIGELANKFEVSPLAMKYRVVSLGYKMKDNG